MNKVSNFLWKLFSVTMAFFYYVENNPSLATDPIRVDETTEDAATRAPNCSTETEDSSKSQLREICPKGTFLYSCRGFRIGTAWLKPMQYTFRNVITDENGKETEEQYFRTTKDYFDYSDDYMVNIKNLKLFFGATSAAENGGVMYYTEAKNSSQAQHANVSDYKISRDMILSQFCNPLDPYPQFECANCPWPGTTADASTVKVQYGKILCDTWKINTFADCFINSFEDSTGKYIYQADGLEHQAQPCYYSNSDNSQTYGKELIDDETRVTNNARYYVSNPFSSSNNRRYY